MSSNEIHISSFIVFCRTEWFKQVETELNKLAQVDIYARDHCGKFVVVIETHSLNTLMQTIDKIGCINGVINTPMVYHQIDQGDISQAQSIL